MDTMWPRKGDTLFKPRGYQHLAACIVTDFSLAATGYQDAAGLLIASLNEAERNDALVFPIIFCYRQYLELKLKVLAGHLRAFAGTDVRPIHDLAKLWSPLKAYLLEKATPDDRPTVEVVDACISEFASIDPQSTTFRYPEYSKLEKHHQIDLGNLKSVMNRLSTFLDSLEASWENSVGEP